MKLSSNIEVIEIPVHTDAWYDFRMQGVGSSEVGYILGLSPYKASIEVFHEKLGTKDLWDGQSQAAFHGSQLEGYVADLWKYWDGTDEGYMKNFDAGKEIRSCEHYGVKDKYFVNKKYPWLFVSLDGLINSGGARMDTGEILQTHGVLECKLISGFVLKNWEHDIPPQYLAQLHVAMLIMETDYAELAMLKDGKNFGVDSVPLSKKFAQVIIERSKEFWYKRVLPARELQKKMREAENDGKYVLSQEYEGELQKLEPEPDGTEAYKNFLAKNALVDPVSMKGGMEQLDWLETMKNVNALTKRLKEASLLAENRIRKVMKDEKVDKIEFGDNGYCKLSERKGSDKLTLGNQIDYKATQEYIETEFKKLKLISE